MRFKLKGKSEKMITCFLWGLIFLVLLPFAGGCGFMDQFSEAGNSPGGSASEEEIADGSFPDGGSAGGHRGHDSSLGEAFAGEGFADSFEDEGIFSEAEEEFSFEKAVVRIEAGNIAGSGILGGAGAEDGKIFILTASHVLDNLQPGEYPRVVFPDGKEYDCDGIVKAEAADAALLFLSEKELAERLREENCFIRVDLERFGNIGDGDECIAVGGGDGEERDVCTGEILDKWIYMEDYGQYMIWADTAIRPGMSGGGLFDADGYFLGILSGGSEDGQSAAVPLSLILSEFHNLLD